MKKTYCKNFHFLNKKLNNILNYKIQLNNANSFLFLIKIYKFLLKKENKNFKIKTIFFNLEKYSFYLRKGLNIKNKHLKLFKHFFKYNNI